MLPTATTGETSSGGDTGTVNGQFYGTGHEGVAGSVERDDLIAAFGAERQ